MESVLGKSPEIHSVTTKLVQCLDFINFYKAPEDVTDTEG